MTALLLPTAETAGLTFLAFAIGIAVAALCWRLLVR